MRKRIAVVVSAVVLVGAFASTGQGEPINSPNIKPQIVKRTILWPKRQRIVVKHFDPWAKPTVAQVHRIIAEEAKRWGNSPGRMASRISCESSFHWGEGYAGHLGLLQYLPSTWARAVSTLGDRRVRIVDRKRVMRHARLERAYPDGHTSTRVLHRKRKVKLIVVRKGRLPKRPSIWHGWAQVRAGSQSMAGQSAVGDSEWACR